MPQVSLDISSVDWDILLKNGQHGRGPFIGTPHQRGGQRGRGLAGLLTSLVGMLPTFFNSDVGKEILNTGKAVVSDVISGEPVGSTIKKRARQSVRNLTGLGKKSIKRPVGVLKPHKPERTKRKRSVLLR